MGLPRLFIAPDCWRQEIIELDNADTHYLADVLRLRTGARVLLLDGEGRAAEAEILAILNNKREMGGRSIRLAVKNRFVAGGEPPRRFFLVLGIPKGEKMELILQKGTELGAAGFIPVITSRTIVRLEGERIPRRRARWQAVVKEAAEQCRRALLPLVEEPVFFTEWLTEWVRKKEQGGRKLLVICCEEGVDTGLRELLRREKSSAYDEVYLVVGPEGGFDREEVTAACAAGAQPVSLGPRILRAETAAIVALTLIGYEWGDIGK